MRLRPENQLSPASRLVEKVGEKSWPRKRGRRGCDDTAGPPEDIAPMTSITGLKKSVHNAYPKIGANTKARKGVPNIK